MGEGVNIAARLEGVAKPGAICLSEQAYWQVKGRLDLAVTDLGSLGLKNIAEPVRAYSLEVGVPSRAKPVSAAKPPKKHAWLAPLVLAIAALLVAIAGGAWHFLAARNTGAKNLEATDFVMRGKALQMKMGGTKEGYEAAIAMYQKALAIDPDQVEALAGESVLSGGEMIDGWRPIDKDLVAKALSEADKAIALAPNSAIGYIAKADNLLFFTGRYNEALRVADEGLAINPSSVGLHVSRSFANMNLRQYEQVKTDIQQAMRLSPRDSGMGPFHEILAFAEFGLGNFDASVEEFGKAIDAGRRQFRTYVGLAAAYAIQDKSSRSKRGLGESPPNQFEPHGQVFGLSYLQYTWILRGPEQGRRAQRMNALVRVGRAVMAEPRQGLPARAAGVGLWP